MDVLNIGNKLYSLYIDYFLDIFTEFPSNFINFHFYVQELLKPRCYESKLKELSNETTLVLSNTRELDRVPSTK